MLFLVASFPTIIQNANQNQNPCSVTWLHFLFFFTPDKHRILGHSMWMLRATKIAICFVERGQEKKTTKKYIKLNKFSISIFIYVRCMFYPSSEYIQRTCEKNAKSILIEIFLLKILKMHNAEKYVWKSKVRHMNTNKIKLSSNLSHCSQHSNISHTNIHTHPQVQSMACMHAYTQYTHIFEPIEIYIRYKLSSILNLWQKPRKHVLKQFVYMCLYVRMCVRACECVCTVFPYYLQVAFSHAKSKWFSIQHSLSHTFCCHFCFVSFHFISFHFVCDVCVCGNSFP